MWKSLSLRQSCQHNHLTNREYRLARPAISPTKSATSSQSWRRVSRGALSGPKRTRGYQPLLAVRRQGLVGPVDALCTSFHVALDTMDARRLRADPHLVSIPGFVLLDTGDYEPVLALVSLELFWRMQGMDILAYTRAVTASVGRTSQAPDVWQRLARRGHARPELQARPRRPRDPIKVQWSYRTHPDLLHASEFAQCALGPGEH